MQNTEKLFSNNFPIYLLDYIYIMILYIIIPIILGGYINNHLLPTDNSEIKKEKTFTLFYKILMQLVLQGFIIICIIYLMKKIPSPFSKINNYNPDGPIGQLVRNPAIMSVIMFYGSSGVHERLSELYTRI